MTSPAGGRVVSWMYVFEHDGETYHALSCVPFIEPWIVRKQASVTPLVPESLLTAAESERAALAAGVRALADELAEEAAAITDDAHQMDHAIGLALVTFIDRLRALLAGDGEHNTGDGK